jgi:hypothetical protein
MPYVGLSILSYALISDHYILFIYGYSTKTQAKQDHSEQI